MLLFRLKPKFKLGLLVGGLIGTVIGMLGNTTQSRYGSLLI